MAKKRTGKIEILDDSFTDTLGVVDSGNLRVTFKDGSSLDMYINHEGTQLFITINGSEHKTVLVGGTETDFVIETRKVRS
jgi:hypothetical protein